MLAAFNVIPVLEAHERSGRSPGARIDPWNLHLQGSFYKSPGLLHRNLLHHPVHEMRLAICRITEEADQAVFPRREIEGDEVRLSEGDVSGVVISKE